MGNPTRLLEAARLAEYWDNYASWIKNASERPDRIGQGEAKPLQKELYVYPFDLEFNFANQRVKVQGTDSEWTTRKADFNAFTTDTWTGGEKQIIKVPRYRPAKIIFVAVANGGKGEREVSDRTKRPYLKYETTSTSIPFGRDIEGRSETQAFNLLKALYVARISKTFKISRQREKI